MIEMTELSRHYGSVVAVDRVSCRINQGEVVGLLGHNGAGKTTVMKMLTGYLEATSGDIRIEGLDIRTERMAIQKKIGYLPENCPVYPEMTVVGYLNHRAELLGMPESERPAALRQALVQTGLVDRVFHRIDTLSRGLRQRVGVAQAILHRPSIVILDEPTNGLDPEQIQQMRNLISSLAQQATVIVSTHILSEVEAVCERVLMMAKGKLVLDEKLDDLNRTRALLVEIGQSGKDAAEKLRSVSEVKTVEAVPGESGLFRLRGEGDQMALSAAVSRYVHEQGWSLYRLQPEARSLESVFREVNEKVLQEVVNA